MSNDGLTLYRGCNPRLQRISIWITNNVSSSVHRFFDTSPFSPSNRLIVFTRINFVDGHLIDEGDEIDIVVSEINTGIKLLVGRTSAWDTQVGAHAQWGFSDKHLFYNSILKDTHGNSVPRGVVYDTQTQLSSFLECPVYQVSPCGKFTISPDLSKIKYSQLGYGISVRNSTRNIISPKDDGIYISNVETGRCRLLISLHELSKRGGLNPMLPTYGFHTKWSSDGQLILVVVRTLIPSHDPLLTYTARSPKRQQHLFVMTKDASYIRRIVSWPSFYASSCTCSATERENIFLSDQHQDSSYCETSSSQPTTKRLWSSFLNRFGISDTASTSLRVDGNHPNWVPGTHRISMNLRYSCGRTSKSATQPFWSLVTFDVTDSMLRGSGRQGTGTMSSFFDHPGTTTEELDDKDSHARTTHARPAINAPFSIVFTRSSGHPNFAAEQNGRYVILDAYDKEATWFHRSGACTSVQERCEDCVPLRLVDTWTKREVTLAELHLGSLAQMQNVGSNRLSLGSLSLWRGGRSKVTSEKVARAWRCDAHPAFSRDFTWIALNIRPPTNYGDSGGDHNETTPLRRYKRQVAIAYLGSNLSRYFL